MPTIALIVVALLALTASQVASAEDIALPFAAQWNVGAWPGSFDPSWQVQQLRAGRPLLTTFNVELPERAPAPSYFEPATRALAETGEAIALVSTQWEMLLSRLSKEYPARDAAGHISAVSPFGPTQPWYEVGKAWSTNPMIVRMQQLYPNPPKVIFVSNNEHPRATWRSLARAPEVLAKAGPNPDEAAVRRVVGDAWVERYALLIRGFREGLTAPAWRDHAVFIGYDAFSMVAAGRWWGWVDYSLHVPGRMEPWSRAWDGASVSFYVHDWAGDSDYTVWSPEIEAMNYVPVLEQVRREKPDYLFELSVWDGQVPGARTDKASFYRRRGERLSPARVGGMTQFGMWLLRPHIVREFRGPADDRTRFGAYFEETLKAVERVRGDAVLKRFWTTGHLLANTAEDHPYQQSLPFDFAKQTRWFLLDSTDNPRRPWRLDTPLEVFALALETGAGSARQWLVYAYSPRHESLKTDVQIPGGPRVRVASGESGCFSLVSRGGASVQLVTCGSPVKQ